MENYTKNAPEDPVCGMRVNRRSTSLASSHEGKIYYFCAGGCKKAFEENPNKYLKPKGLFGRFLERLAQSNRDQFGSGGPSCCH